MKLTHQPFDLYYRLQDEENNQIGGAHRTVGAAIEAAIRSSQYRDRALTIWESEGRGGSSMNTILLSVVRKDETVTIREVKA